MPSSEANGPSAPLVRGSSSCGGVGPEERVDPLPDRVRCAERRQPEPPAGHEQPQPRAQGRHRVGCEEEDQRRGQHVGGGVGKSQLVGRAQRCRDLHAARLLGPPPGELDHGGRDVDRGHRPRRPHGKRGREGDGPAAAPDVDHAFAGHERECVDETLRDRREERHPALVVVVGELVEEPRDAGGRIVSIVHPPMVAESGDRRETRPRVLRGEHRMRG
jgi:hypothetical protein